MRTTLRLRYMVPRVPLDIPWVQDAQSEAPSFAGLRNTHPQIGDLIILGIAPQTVPKTDLAHPEGTAGPRCAESARRHADLGACCCI